MARIVRVRHQTENGTYRTFPRTKTGTGILFLSASPAIANQRAARASSGRRLQTQHMRHFRIDPSVVKAAGAGRDCRRAIAQIGPRSSLVQR